ncbi:NUDIX hydrolase [Abyssicoccus albus]|uniref:ADP-ribose pyrophosphatase YjhB (NUDIX family) n=1 Tax=Abyssicoccus albus TaxID=1817405 RepID=A0A3N5BHQ4_9BACL|nr:NUDIX domain-containing protein [Abyssicoccus albus]RPF54810.1 ADP-ribose pyrophosphatase YjhB (NUDIX family) [Abyssicoccus albus]
MVNYVQTIREKVGHMPLLLPGSIVIILNNKGQVLLQERADGDQKYGLPGGLMELYESAEETAVREVKEETGLHIYESELNLINVHTGKDWVVKLDNEDVFQPVSIVYYTTKYDGELTIDHNETKSLKFFHRDELPNHMVLSQRKYIEQFNAMIQSGEVTI